MYELIAEEIQRLEHCQAACAKTYVLHLACEVLLLYLTRTRLECWDLMVMKCEQLLLQESAAPTQIRQTVKL